MSFPTPTTISGGCLCGGVRYQVDFAADHDWKKAPLTCQCTQCRKNCGALIYHLHSVKESEIKWLSKATYAEYESSPGYYRAFCKDCGSSLCWGERKGGTNIDLAVGTVDEKFLVGEKRDSEDRGVGGFGLALANPGGQHHHLRNEIQGVTEKMSLGGCERHDGEE